MYTLEERQIFTARVGNVEVKADPVAVNRRMAVRLKKEGRDLDGLLQTVAHAETAEEVILSDAMDVLLDVVRSEFKLKSFEEDPDNGLTEAETMKLLEEFLMFVFDVKKNIENSPNGSESTESSPGDVTSDTSSTPVSGSTGTE